MGAARGDGLCIRAGGRTGGGGGRPVGEPVHDGPAPSLLKGTLNVTSQQQFKGKAPIGLQTPPTRNSPSQERESAAGIPAW